MRIFILLISLLVFQITVAADFETEILDNGLTVIVNSDATAPVVTICIAVKTGATCETPETNGLAHFYEHMFFKGNEALPDQTVYNRRMGELGISRNGTTYPERVQYFLTIVSDRFEEGIEFMADAILTPLFDIEEMEREREVIMNEYERGLTHSFHNLSLAKDGVLYSDAPWRISAIGVPEVIRAAAPPAMYHFQETYYTPDNSVLIIAGDVEYAEAFTLAEEYFSEWEFGGKSNYEDLPILINIEKDTTVYVDSPSGIGYVSVVYEGPSIATQPEETYPADVWGSYLGLMSREFYTDLVTNGPFLSISGSYYTQRFSPRITFSGMISPDDAELGMELLHEEIEQLQDISYYDEEGIEMAKAEFQRHRLLAEETAYDVAVKSLPFWWVVAGNLDYYCSYQENIEAVELNEIDCFLQTWITDMPHVTFIMIPFEEGEE